MANLTVCDSCSTPMEKEAPRYRVLLFGKPEGIFDISGMKEGHDFCSLACVGTWAVSREIDRAKR